jgi:transcriptional regulator with XRE-family HTH domain
MGKVQKKFIGQTISTERKKLGITQFELAKKAKLSRSYISDLETGRYAPSVRSLIAISNVLDLDLNFLLKNDVNTSKGGI